MLHAVRLAGLIAPPLCATCAAGCDANETLCPRCERDLSAGAPRELRIPGIDRAWAARPYEGIARDLIGAIKFRKLVPAARRATELIAAEAPVALARGPFVPVPPDPIRAAWRGFDPAGALAQRLAAATGSPISTCLRRSHGARQVGRSRRDRLIAPPRVRADRPPGTAVLVDDVTTTGATLTACALALRTAGCERVGAVVLAVARA